jgi:CTP:molybdopterin cytidylyltransferase MocA
VITGAVILAAGAGTRLGGVAKALLAIGERTYLQAIVETAAADDAIVVVGPPYGEAVAAEARALGVRVVVNPRPERGMASSIELGFAAIAESDVDAAWLWPVDHPAVAAATLATLAAAFTGDGVRPVHGGRGGHPPLVGRALFGKLAQCSLAPQGARDVLAAAQITNVPVDDPGVIADVDTLADREALA